MFFLQIRKITLKRIAKLQVIDHIAYRDMQYNNIENTNEAPRCAAFA